MKLTAKAVPASSVVGAGITLLDEDGKVVTLLSLLQAGDRAEQLALRDRLVAIINAGQAEGQVRHFKTGVAYDVLPEALFQVSTPDAGAGPYKIRQVADGDPVVVYRNPEGMHFVRFPDEMVSPRFEKVQS